VRRRTTRVGGAATLLAGGLAAGSFVRMGSQRDYADAAASMRAPLRRDPDSRELVRAATLAANDHNTQPWRFVVSDRSIRILPDFSRRTPVVDPDGHHLFASLGCAAANLALAAQGQGRNGELRYDAADGGSVVFDFAPGAARTSPLCDAIPRRQSTRAPFDGRAVLASELALLERAAALDSVDVVLITDRARLDRVRDLVIAGNSAQMADPAFVAELKAWMRFNPRAALQSGDGLYSAASGNPALPSWLGARMFDLVFRASAENDKYARQMASSAGVAVFVGARDDPAYWVRVGQACQRFALQATALGLKQSFVNQPVEVAGLRPELAALVGLQGQRADIVMRFGYGPSLPMSPRRPVEAVLTTRPA
jgi:nitroreductase